MPAAPELAQTFRSFVHDRLLAAMNRYFPTLRVPATFAGYRIGTEFAVDFIYTLKFLYKAGYTHLGTRAIPEILRAILLQIDGKATTTFYSYRVAEILLAFGTFEDANPLLAGFTRAQKDNLAEAVDSSGTFNPVTKDLRGLANNYWAVVGRCEFDRRQLGLLKDDTLLKLCMEKVRAVLAGNASGFFDDSTDQSSRFDLYSFDTHLFLEPMWHLLDAKILAHNFRRHAEVMEQITMRNGAVVVWGRSVGALSVMMTMEFGALALRDNLASDPARMLGLVRHAFEKFRKEWFADDLVDAHRHKMTFNYRGPQRLLQMTFDLLYKLAWAADALAAANVAQPPPAVINGPALEGRSIDSDREKTLFPSRDVFIDLRPATAASRAGVWMFRNQALDFQLAAVGANAGDYVATPRSPGLFENPVDSFLVCGVPRVWRRAELASPEIEFIPNGAPATVEKTENGLILTYGSFTRAAPNFTGNPVNDEPKKLEGTRQVAYKVVGDTLHVSESLTFGGLPSAVSLSLPETVARPLRVHFRSNSEHSASVVGVEGMQFWRSFWGSMGRVHQIDFAPAREIQFSYTITPVLKVAHGPAVHDYNRSFYDNMTPGLIQEIPLGNAVCGYLSERAELFVKDADIVHIAWPEHLFTPHGMPEKEFDELLIGFFRKIRAAGKKIVWTMHNRRPHTWAKERGMAVYRELASITDACFHHSKWGEGIMRRDYPFPAHCRHYQIPHPHFGAMMRTALSRGELEKKHGIPPAKIRIGLLGRYQPEKQIEMILAAFVASGRTDLQLVYNTYKELPTALPANPPAAGNIFRLERAPWMDRKDIAEHTNLCDALVAAHTGDTYLTSGLMGDTLGIGIPIIVPHWEFFDEILGDAAIYHDNTVESLTAVFRNLTVESVAAAREKSVALAPKYAPAVLAPLLEKALREVRLS